MTKKGPKLGQIYRRSVCFEGVEIAVSYYLKNYQRTISEIILVPEY